ncbi:hypothetical protein OF83DRAFT_1081869 [Amylostereum chailletii]|nr:hypothetical protein OF83DRAFT_1081869 [Amylostereum chailletii]
MFYPLPTPSSSLEILPFIDHPRTPWTSDGTDRVRPGLLSVKYYYGRSIVYYIKLPPLYPSRTVRARGWYSWSRTSRDSEENGYNPSALLWRRIAPTRVVARCVVVRISAAFKEPHVRRKSKVEVGARRGASAEFRRWTRSPRKTSVGDPNRRYTPSLAEERIVPRDDAPSPVKYRLPTYHSSFGPSCTRSNQITRKAEKEVCQSLPAKKKCRSFETLNTRRRRRQKYTLSRDRAQHSYLSWIIVPDAVTSRLTTTCRVQKNFITLHADIRAHAPRLGSSPCPFHWTNKPTLRTGRGSAAHSRPGHTKPSFHAAQAIQSVRQPSLLAVYRHYCTQPLWTLGSSYLSTRRNLLPTIDEHPASRSSSAIVTWKRNLERVAASPPRKRYTPARGSFCMLLPDRKGRTEHGVCEVLVSRDAPAGTRRIARGTFWKPSPHAPQPDPKHQATRTPPDVTAPFQDLTAVIVLPTKLLRTYASRGHGNPEQRTLNTIDHATQAVVSNDPGRARLARSVGDSDRILLGHLRPSRRERISDAIPIPYVHAG